MPPLYQLLIMSLLLLGTTMTTMPTLAARRSRIDLSTSPQSLPSSASFTETDIKAIDFENDQTPVAASNEDSSQKFAGRGINTGNKKSTAGKPMKRVQQQQQTKSQNFDIKTFGDNAVPKDMIPISSSSKNKELANAATTAAPASSTTAAATTQQLPQSKPKTPSQATKEQINRTEQKQPQIEQKNSGYSNAVALGVEDIDLVEKLASVNAADNNNIEDCDTDMLGFEIITGYVFSAPDKLLDSLPGTLMLTDCLEACQTNESCQAVNYETGLCVLFSSNADKQPGALTKSQFPVFTIYAQKSCLGVRPCARAWCVDRVQNYKLITEAKRSMSVTSRRDCLELCLGETEFTCRSANYFRAKNTCELSEMDRITLAGTQAFQATEEGIDYLENNCAEEPNKLCEFKRLSGRILKTVDSVYQDVGSIDECRDLCLNSAYRCHSYDYGDTGDMVCRLSHHSRATLTDVKEPYLDVPEAATYELASCYNVTIECGAGNMITRIRTSKLFNGKVYAKGSPKSCSVDVQSALDFEIRMGYQDLECNVRQLGAGRYMNDVVIQHHDTIVTSSDLGLAVTCQYDLTNKSVTNEFDFGVKGDIEPALSEEVIVDSPNVVMKITTRDGSDIMRSAEVGDPLALKFEILDEQSPYEIFVRELVAMDGGDNAEITLIDSDGCPTDHFIMGPIYKSALSGKILLSHFDAFKFPSSEVVQFRALVTPCMPTCEPVQCNQNEYAADGKSLLSYGRRRRRSVYNATANYNNNDDEQQHDDVLATAVHRRRRETTTTTSQEDMLLVQSIQITDKFGFDKQQQQQQNNNKKSTAGGNNNNESIFITNESISQGFCVNAFGLIVASTIFLLLQLCVISVWTYLCQRRRKDQEYHDDNKCSSSVFNSQNASSTVISNLPQSRNDCNLYDGGFGAGRHGRQF